MSNYKVEQLHDPNCKEIASVLNLFKQIPGRTCSASAYLDSINTNWLLTALIVIKKDEDIIAFTHASAPDTLEPKIAWLPFSYASPDCPKELIKQALQMAISWMKGFGANKMMFTTVRSTRALAKAWGMKKSNEVLMEKDI